MKGSRGEGDGELTYDSQATALCTWPNGANIHRESRQWGGEACKKIKSYALDMSCL